MPNQISTQPLTFGEVNVLVPGTAYLPVRPGTLATALPLDNCNTVTVLNTGGNPMLFGSYYLDLQSNFPSTLNGVATVGGTGPAIFPQVGFNCTVVPAGASVTFTVGSYQERGNMTLPVNYTIGVTGVPSTLFFPMSLIFFSSTGGPTTGVVTYSNRLGFY